jgi:hypothetical protein
VPDEAGPEEADAEADDTTEDEPEPVGGVGAVEGEDAVGAHDAASEAHESAVEGVNEAEEVAAEVAADEAEADDSAAQKSDQPGEGPETDALSAESEARGGRLRRFFRRRG